MKQSKSKQNRVNRCEHQVKQGLNMQIKQRKNEQKVNQGFKGKSMRVHTQGKSMQPICMHTYTTSMRTYASSIRMHTRPKNPNPETIEKKTQNKKLTT